MKITIDIPDGIILSDIKALPLLIRSSDQIKITIACEMPRPTQASQNDPDADIRRQYFDRYFDYWFQITSPDE